MLWGRHSDTTPSQKEQFLYRLLVRVGHAESDSVDPPFVFNAVADNSVMIPQLEAVIEFYVNFTEPWSGEAPRSSKDPGYITVSLSDPHGEAASTAGGVVVALDGNPDLSCVIPNPEHNPAAGVAAGGVPQPDFPAPLTYLYDTLCLDADTARPSKTYRILAVDNTAKTVTLDAAPNCPGNTSAWTLNRRPTIVIIDPFGPRVFNGVTLAGTQATAGPDPKDRTRTILTLDSTIPLDKVNAGFDTIHLDADDASPSGRPGPVYRIYAVDPGAHTVTVVGTPALHDGVSAWQIPAGLGGVAPNLDYDLGPQYARNRNGAAEKSRGYDHYDAALFIVHRGQVAGQRIYRWTSYTSRAYGTWSVDDKPSFKNWQQELSSVDGNARFYYSSYYSGEPFKNFTFAVVDAGSNHSFADYVAADAVEHARFYYGTPHLPAGVQATPDTLDPHVWADNDQHNRPGKGAIRLHRGNLGGRFGTGSAGCLVAIDYVAMRTDLLGMFEKDYVEFHGPNTYDTYVRQVLEAYDNKHSDALYRKTVPVTDKDGKPVLDENNNPKTKPAFPKAGWNGKVVGNLWLIRPDERPVDAP